VHENGMAAGRQITVVPNPFPSKSRLVLVPPGRETVDIVAYDVLGRKALVLGAGSNDVSHLAPGVYFLQDAHSSLRLRPARRMVIIR